MSLVELLCAIAIMSIVGASVAGIMVVSANSYNRGSNDAEMQQTAQLLAIQVENTILDLGFLETYHLLGGVNHFSVFAHQLHF